MQLPVECLENLTLDNGWKVEEKVTKRPEDTGGYFSSGYIVSKDGKKAFLKAFDFSVVLRVPAAQQPKILQEQLEIYNFEKDILDKCRDKKLSKVTIPIDDGSVLVSGYDSFLGRVYYIIFELADGNIRNIKEKFRDVDLAFIFRSLHNIAVGMNQLHKIGVAHQDIKPSNALVFNKETKLSDLGRATDVNKPFKYDDCIAGDLGYLPIEQFDIYKYRAFNDIRDKYAVDLFTFGSLFFFYFADGVSLSDIFQMKIKEQNCFLSGNFDIDLSYLDRFYADIISDFSYKYGDMLMKLLQERL